MSEQEHDEAPSAPTQTSVHEAAEAPPAAPHASPATAVTGDPPAAPPPLPPLPAALASEVERLNAEGPPAAPPAPAPPAGPVKKPLEDWARAKGCHPFIAKTVMVRGKGGKPKPIQRLVRNTSPEKHFYAGALAKWKWVPSMEVTEQEFDEAFLEAKHGTLIGTWPHPDVVKKSLAARMATLFAAAALAREAGEPSHLMGALPDVVTTVVDNALGITGPSSTNAVALIGSTSAGTVNTVYGFNDVQTLTTTLISGPAVELAAYMLSQPGHGTVYVVPCTCATAGACGSTTYTRVGSSTGTIVASGAAYDAYSFVITITLGEASVSGGGGTFTYSQDGGNTTSPVIAIPTGGTYAVPGTNVTLTFAGSSTAFSTGDVATIPCTAPYYSGANFTSAFNVLAANPATWRCVVAVGAAASASAAATFASTAQSLMSGLEANNDVFSYCALQANDTDANCETAFASFAGNRVAVGAGQAQIVSNVSGDDYTRDAIWAAMARIVTRPVSEDAGCVATGPLNGVSSLLRNEQLTPGLDAARFITLRTIIGKQGFYITDGWTMAAAGSDFQLLQNRQVMDVACTAARAAELDFLNSTLRVNPASVSSPLVPGAIDPRDAEYIQTEVTSAIRTALNIGVSDGSMPAGDASDCTVIVNQSTNILSSETIPITVRVTPNAYGKYIENNIGLVNPAFQLAA